MTAVKRIRAKNRILAISMTNVTNTIAATATTNVKSTINVTNAIILTSAIIADGAPANAADAICLQETAAAVTNPSPSGPALLARGDYI